MASARIMLTSTVLILLHWSFCTSWGTVLVTTTCRIGTRGTRTFTSCFGSREPGGGGRSPRCPYQGFYLIDGRLLYECGRVCRQQAVRGHDVNLVGTSLLQDVCCCNKVLHVIYDVILIKKETWIR